MAERSSTITSENLSGMDISAALGMVAAKAKFGMVLCLGKYGESKEDQKRSVEMFAQFASRKAPKSIKKTAGSKFGCCLRIMAGIAYKEFCRSALSVEPCSCCQGKGLVRKRQKFSNKLAIRWEENKTSIPKSVWIIKEVNQPPARTEWEEVTWVCCPLCRGRGYASARCRCHGTGSVLDSKASQFQGVPVVKACPKCKGRGFKRIQPSTVHHAVKKLLPGLPERTWRYSWKPLYESMLVKCHQEEGEVESIFRKVTR